MTTGEPNSIKSSIPLVSRSSGSEYPLDELITKPKESTVIGFTPNIPS